MQVGAVFGLIFALIVMGLILFFGSEQLMNIICIGNIGQTNKVVKNLEYKIDDIQACSHIWSIAFVSVVTQVNQYLIAEPEE